MAKKKRPSKTVNALFLVIGLACLLYYLANGVLIRFNQSLLWLWLIIGAACLTRFALVGQMIRTGKRSPIPKILLKIGHALVAVLLVCFVIISSIILSSAFTSPRQNADAVIVLGAKVNGEKPSGALYNRIVCAYEYLTENENTICIASGGQGADEGISEAQCIYNELTEMGIDGSRIILEDKSTSTLENLTFGLELLQADAQNVVIITNNCHVYRALKLAQSVDKEHSFSALPVATSFISLPHFIMREFAAVVVGTVSGNFSD